MHIKNIFFAIVIASLLHTKTYTTTVPTVHLNNFVFNNSAEEANYIKTIFQYYINVLQSIANDLPDTLVYTKRVLLGIKEKINSARYQENLESLQITLIVIHAHIKIINRLLLNSKYKSLFTHLYKNDKTKIHQKYITKVLNESIAKYNYKERLIYCAQEFEGLPFSRMTTELYTVSIVHQ